MASSARRRGGDRRAGATLELVGVMVVCALVVGALVGRAPTFATALSGKAERAVCAVTGSACPRPAPLAISGAPRVIEASAKAAGGGRRVRTYSADTDPATADERGFGRGDACATIPGGELCRGTMDGRITRRCPDDEFCDYYTAVPIDAIPGVVCATAPNETSANLTAAALRTLPHPAEQLCTYETRAGTRITARCTETQGSTLPAPLERCTDTTADAYAIRAGADIKRCYWVSEPSRETFSAVLTAETEWAYSAICVTWGGSVYSCHTKVTTLLGLHPTRTPAPRAFNCDNREIPPDRIQCPALDTPGVQGCLAADRTPLRCLIADGAARHCAEDRRSALVELPERCPPPGARRALTGDPFDALTLPFCQQISQQEMVGGLLRAARSVGVHIGPNGEVERVRLRDADTHPVIGPIVAAADAARRRVRNRYVGFRAPLIVLQPDPGEHATSLEVLPVINPDGTVSFASLQALEQAAANQGPLPADHVVMALPPGMPVAAFPGPEFAPGVLVVAPGVTPAQLDFGHVLAWLHQEPVQLLAPAQLQVLAALAVPELDVDFLPAHIADLVTLARRLLPGWIWRNVVVDFALSFKSPERMLQEFPELLDKRLRRADKDLTEADRHELVALLVSLGSA